VVDRSHHFQICPRCGLTIKPRLASLAVEHCPRCVARSRVAVRLFASTLPARELYAGGTEPRPSDVFGRARREP
jgi:hypothetical protein